MERALLSELSVLCPAADCVTDLHPDLGPTLTLVQVLPSPQFFHFPICETGRRISRPSKLMGRNRKMRVWWGLRRVLGIIRWWLSDLPWETLKNCMETAGLIHLLLTAPCHPAWSFPFLLCPILTT